MNALIREKTKLERQTSDERIRTTDKSAKVARIAAINKEIQQTIYSNQTLRERKIVDDIKNNTKAFFKDANNNKKLASKLVL